MCVFQAGDDETENIYGSKISMAEVIPYRLLASKSGQTLPISSKNDVFMTFFSLAYRLLRFS